MRCNQAKELISLSMDEPIEEFDRSRLADHLANCADCLHHQEILLSSRELLHGGLQAPSENFEWKVQLGIQRQLREGARRLDPTPNHGRFWLPVAATAVAVAAVVLVSGSMLLPGTSSSPVRDLSRGERPALLPEVGATFNLGHQTGAGRSSGILPSESSLPIGVRQEQEPSLSALQQEREVLIEQIFRLRIENARLRALQAPATLSEPSRQEP